MKREDFYGLGKFRATGLNWFRGVWRQGTLQSIYFEAGRTLHLRAVTTNNYDSYAVSIHGYAGGLQIAWLANNSERAKGAKQVIHHLLLQGAVIIATPCKLHHQVQFEHGLVLWMKR